MKNTMKKMLSLFLVAVMLVTAVPFTRSGVSESDPLSLPKSTYEVGEAIIPEIWDVSYSSWDWIGLYLKDDSIDGSVESLWWIYAAYVTDSTNFANGTGGQDFTPNTTRPDFYNYFVNGLIAPGKYKLVYFEDDSYTSTDCEYFTVVEGNPGQGGEVVNPDGERPDVTNVSVGDKITLGTYNGEPITWVCVEIDENGPLMLSEDVLCYKQFDAAGSDSTYHTDGWGYIRESYGSNCWYDSNIRQWLNTSGTIEYSHCKPIYSNEAGFMSNFSEAELSCVKNVTQKTYVNSWESKRTGYTDGGSTAVPPVTTIAELDRDYSSYWYQNVTDSFFLLGQEQIYNIYSNDSSYVYSDTPYVTRIVGNNDVGACFEQVYVVNGKNSLAISSAYSNNGIRPAFYLETKVEEEQPNNIYNLGDETYSFPNFEDYHSPGGHCFGMSITSSAYYLGLLDMPDVGCDKANDLPENDIVKQPICYYQEIQGSIRNRAMVAGGTNYKNSKKINVEKDWNEVVNYVKNHEYDNSGLLQIGYTFGEDFGHAVNFLRYDEENNVIIAYDNNYPNDEICIYEEDGKVYTMHGEIKGITLRSVPCYLEEVSDAEKVNKILTRSIYAIKNTVSVSNAVAYIMDVNDIDGGYYVYEIPEGETTVKIIPLVDNATFTYMDKEYSFGKINEDTYAELTLVGDEIEEAEFEIVNEPEEHKEHTNSEWITNKAPTCTEEGSKHIECTECGEILETEIIEKLSHEYTTEITVATCTAKGYTTYTCVCGDSYTADYTDKISHTYNAEGICEMCGKDRTDNCSHICHETGFMGFIWKILRFFFKLFGSNPVCSCGASHY